ncbi:MAG: putative addiction module antidote protein [Treponema sp.]|nr:putative addiction module antidote protein [Treponema sp.]
MKTTGKEKITFKDWDLAETLETKEDIIAHLETALSEGDIKFLYKILGALSRSKGMTQIAKGLGVTREGLYKSLSPAGRPSFDTIVKLIDLLGLKIRLEDKCA